MVWYQQRSLTEIHPIPAPLQPLAEKIMHKAELDEDGQGVRVGGLRLTNLWYADDTTLMAESSEDLKMLITKVKEECKCKSLSEHQEDQSDDDRQH